LIVCASTIASTSVYSLSALRLNFSAIASRNIGRSIEAIKRYSGIERSTMSVSFHE
jgi:hypothetical protein